ncbi:MAG: hypothetical protein V4532_14265 [Pseudomonadota bacterium]
MSNECLAADVYFGDDKLPSVDIQAVLMPALDSAGDRVIRVTTRKVVDEPVITIYLAAGCGSKITRKFVAFADPPNMAMPVVQSPSENAPASYSAKPGRVSLGGYSIETGDSTIVAAPIDEVAARPKSKSKRRDKTEAVSTAAAASGAETLKGAPSFALSAKRAAQAAKTLPESVLAQHAPGPSGRAKGQAKEVAGERLVLDPLEAEIVNLPGLRMSAGLQGQPPSESPSAEVLERRAAAAALWLILNASPDQIYRDQQRVKELEQRLATMQQDADKARRAVADMEVRVRRAEAVQTSPLMLYGLGAMVVLLAAALAALLMKGRGKSGTGLDWLKSTAEPVAADHHEPRSAEDALSRTFAGFKPVTPVDAPSPSSAPEPVVKQVAPTAAPVSSEPLPTFVMADAAASRPVRTERSEPPREVSVEELIDLEQQAEFFIVLGQDDAAIDLLESHVQSTTGASPLPFLKLLEIYQRLGRRSDYERVQAEFNQRFNGYAPAWESDLMHGRNLPDYPGVVDRIQSLWSSPGKAMDVLERSLTRPDAEVETFDLPAYRELLFLYAVARDLSEKESEARLVVNLTEDFTGTHEDVLSNEVDEPLMASRPIKAIQEAMPSISLDLSLDDLEPLDTVIDTVLDSGAESVPSSANSQKS